MDHTRPDFLAMNPNGEVPVLEHGDRVLYDSAVICEYLDAAFAGGDHESVYPADAPARAQTRMWIAYDQGMHKEWRPLFFQTIVGPVVRARDRAADIDRAGRGPLPGHAALLEKAAAGTLLAPEAESLVRGEILRMLDRVEAALACSPFLVGERPTAADMAWFSRVELFPRLGLELAPGRFANVRAWFARLREIPAFASEVEEPANPEPATDHSAP
jgi:glutathione S-transferase